MLCSTRSRELHACEGLKGMCMRMPCKSDSIAKRLHTPEHSHVASVLHFEGYMLVLVLMTISAVLIIDVMLSADVRVICEGGLGEVSLLPRLDRQRPTNCILAVRLLLHPGK